MKQNQVPDPIYPLTSTRSDELIQKTALWYEPALQEGGFCFEEVIRVQTYPYFLHIVQSVKEGREYPEISPNGG